MNIVSVEQTRLSVGLPMYALLGYSQMDKIPLVFKEVLLADSRTGAILLDIAPVSYSNPKLPTFAAIAGPFAVPCDYFNIMVNITYFCSIPLVDIIDDRVIWALKMFTLWQDANITKWETYLKSAVSEKFE